jgi:hypothetical protein
MGLTHQYFEDLWEQNQAHQKRVRQFQKKIQQVKLERQRRLQQKNPREPCRWADHQPVQRDGEPPRLSWNNRFKQNEELARQHFIRSQKLRYLTARNHRRYDDNMINY